VFVFNRWLSADAAMLRLLGRLRKVRDTGLESFVGLCGGELNALGGATNVESVGIAELDLLER